MEIRVIYNDDTKKIIDVVPAEGTATQTPQSIIQDTPENCKIALTALGIDTTPIDDLLTDSAG